MSPVGTTLVRRQRIGASPSVWMGAVWTASTVSPPGQKLTVPEHLTRGNAVAGGSRRPAAAPATFGRMPVDLLAIVAHRDDAELLCGGTLAKAVDAGHRVGILDLSAGEAGTRGSAALRAAEAERAARVLGIHERRNAGLPDAHLQNTDETRRVIVAEVRHFAPRTVIVPYPVGRHPDHRVASELARDACFLAGLAKYDAPGIPHRPGKVLYALAYREDAVKPTFIVDISAQFARKLEAVKCYASQFDGALSAGELYPTGQDLYSLVETQCTHYGSRIRARYGEPFWTPETMAVDDVVTLGVSSL